MYHDEAVAVSSATMPHHPERSGCGPLDVIFTGVTNVPKYVAPPPVTFFPAGHSAEADFTSVESVVAEGWEAYSRPETLVKFARAPGVSLAAVMVLSAISEPFTAPA